MVSGVPHLGRACQQDDGAAVTRAVSTSGCRGPPHQFRSQADRSARLRRPPASKPLLHRPLCLQALQQFRPRAQIFPKSCHLP